MKIDCIETKMMPLYFSSLIINLTSIEKVGYTVERFVSEYNLTIITNGELIMMVEMSAPAYDLSGLVNRLQNEEGLKYKQDCIIVYERLTKGVENRLVEIEFDVELDETKELNWVSSILKKDGCYVWRI